MQWKNKTHELDKKAEVLLDNPDKFKHIYIFGAGKIGSQIMITMQKYNILEGFIDNDIVKQNNGFDGYKVYSLEEYLKIRNGVIVVAVSKKNMTDVTEQLKDGNLLKEKDFFFHRTFCNIIFPIVSVYLFNKAYVNVAQISLTERCTLKCKKCAHGCAAVDNKKAKDLTLEQVNKSADSFFSKIDFIQEFVLIGGEPLMYKQMSDVIKYIGKNYRDKIGIFSITTNGTILPDEEVFKMCASNKVLFRISNYGKSIPRLKNIYKKLTNMLESYGIEYVLAGEESNWTDYGFDYVNHKESKDGLIKIFDACQTPCREVRENRFYFCVMARSVSENMKFNVGEKDYLDLDTLQGDAGTKILLEFNLGYSEKGYLDMCNYCHGADSVNYPIPVAEQA